MNYHFNLSASRGWTTVRLRVSEIEDKIQRELLDFLAGVAGADDRLFRLLRPPLLRLTGRWLEPGEREDAVQYTLLALFKHLRKRDSFEGSFLAYAQSATRNRCIELQRRRARNLEFPDENIDTMGGGGFTDQAAAIAELEIGSRIGRALAILHPACRRLLVRHYYERVPMKDLVADAKANTVQALYSQRKNCLKRLRKNLNNLGEVSL